MFTLIPFTVTLTMFLLLIFSLWRHLKNMQYNAQGSRDVSTVAHIKALQMVACFTHQHYVHIHPLHCDPDGVSPAHLLPVETSEEHAVQRQTF
ncbi:hypothetical protein ACRRTK_006080 [Alexandromys fortis]